MPIEYTRKPGSRKYRDYSQESLSTALAELKKGKTVTAVSKKYGIPYSTLHNKLKMRHTKAVGAPLRLSLDCEKMLVVMLDTLTEWLVPVTDEEIKFLVKTYLDGRDLYDNIFKDNRPGRDWLRGFMRRHNLTRRIADNVTRSRVTTITPENINSYFDHLQRELNGIPPTNIFNYDETNLTDDPGCKTVIVSRGHRRVQCIMEHSKQSTSVMFSGNAAGEYLPTMIVYKNASCTTYSGWTESGPKDAIYDATESGWFDSRTFCRWFFEIFLPHASKVDGPIAVIGDNLSSHFSLAVITATIDHNIRFITLLPCSTHICQPLDVAVFRSLKRNWKKVLVRWRNETKSKGSIPKTQIPCMLKRLVDTALIPEHLVSGFRKCGIFPVDRNEVLQQLPGLQKDPGGPTTVMHINSSVMTLLKEHATQHHSSVKKTRGKKVIHGKRITPDNLLKDGPSTESNECVHCMQPWDRDGDDRWIQCDLCDKWYHLQCSGVDYNIKEYDTLKIGPISFECCKEE